MIIGVAIKIGDEIYTYPRPYRHYNLIAWLASKGINPNKDADGNRAIQGFYSDTGDFMTREEARKHVDKIGQETTQHDMKHKQLYSEDVW